MSAVKVMESQAMEFARAVCSVCNIGIIFATSEFKIRAEDPYFFG